MSTAGVVLTGLILLSFSGVCASFVKNRPEGRVAVSSSASVPSRGGVLVIDPGHGGEDGGAVAADGTEEKAVDLEIAKGVDALCLFLGIPSVMTRTEDEMLYDRYPDVRTGSKKGRDLKNRLRVASEADAALLLSIHTNKFPDESVRGLQVFFSPNGGESRRAAEILQGSLNANLQHDHEKEAKKATSSIYLLDRATVPAVLAECGFLSNADELEKLKTPGYRASVACVLAASAAEFLSGDG